LSRLSPRRSLLDTLIVNMDSDVATRQKAREAVHQPGPLKADVFCYSQTSRALNLFAFLMNQAAMKAAFLHLPHSKLVNLEMSYPKET